MPPDPSEVTNDAVPSDDAVTLEEPLPEVPEDDAASAPIIPVVENPE